MTVNRSTSNSVQPFFLIFMKIDALTTISSALLLLAASVSVAQPKCAKCYTRYNVCVYVPNPGAGCPPIGSGQQTGSMGSVGGGGSGTIKRKADVYLGLALQYMDPAEAQKIRAQLSVETTRFIDDNQRPIKTMAAGLDLNVSARPMPSSNRRLRDRAILRAGQ
jgi:hypothetical protein